MTALARILSILLIVLLGPFDLSAQDTLSASGLESAAGKMADQLKLGPEEGESFKEIIRESMEDIREIQKADSIARSDRLFMVWEVMQTREQKLKNLLGEEGYAMFLIYQDEIKARELKGKGEQARNIELLNAIREELELGPSTEQQLAEILMDYQEEKNLIKQRNIGNTVAIRNQIKTLNQETNIMIQDILNPDQYNEYLRISMEVGRTR